MPAVMPPLVVYNSISEYKTHFEKYYCREKITTFDDIRVYFDIAKFGHAFYESSARNGQKDSFSMVRAERIDWIRVTLENPHAELYQGWNKEEKCFQPDRRVSVLYGDFIVVIELNRQRALKKAKFITAYLADNSIEKIRKSPKWI